MRKTYISPERAKMMDLWKKEILQLIDSFPEYLSFVWLMTLFSIQSFKDVTSDGTKIHVIKLEAKGHIHIPTVGEGYVAIPVRAHTLYDAFTRGPVTPGPKESNGREWVQLYHKTTNPEVVITFHRAFDWWMASQVHGLFFSKACKENIRIVCEDLQHEGQMTQDELTKYMEEYRFSYHMSDDGTIA